ncbi:MAG: hypothetical protein PHQ41_00205 [Candidatus Cloacimonetes bacterium]|jgi:hypothetical protein|nr:hypothetical protein [Candidatus Cloacimonadota bacterium]
MKLDARLIILGLNAALLVFVALSFIAHRQSTWQPPKAIPPALTEMPDVQILHRLDQLNQNTAYISERPLFWPSRRPLPDKPEESSPGSLDEAKLLGTFEDGQTKGAIIRVDKKSGKVIRLLVGENYKGLVLMNVDPFAVKFADPSGKSYSLELEYAKQPNTPASSAKRPEPKQPNP